FPDGNIIQVAEGTAFRVYKGLLAQHSPVFRDMFTIAQPDAANTVDMCPCVPLSDSASGLRQLLRLIVGQVDLFRTETSLRFSAVAAIIHLSNKYQMEHIRNQTLQSLERILAVEPPEELQVEQYLAQSPLAIMLEDAFTLVHLAHVTGSTSLLPVAYYMCCLLPELTLIYGIRRNGLLQRLNPDDVVRCSTWELALMTACATLFLTIFDYETDMERDCLTPRHCRSQFQWEIHTAAVDIPGEITSRDALSSWALRISDGELCSNCFDKFK
ncbi:hypothetical protein OBBRIDRAFT_725512, partial [Obba rivulosa]